MGDKRLMRQGILWVALAATLSAAGTASAQQLTKVTLAESSPSAPALAACRGNLYLAWRGEGKFQLNLIVSKDKGASFSNKITLSEVSPDGPALACDDTILYLGWTGTDKNRLIVAQVKLDASGNPVGLNDKTELEEKSPVRPALAVLDGALYLGWRGDGTDELNVMVSTDKGEHFKAKATAYEKTTYAPALASHRGSLYLSWSGKEDNRINVARITIAHAEPRSFASKFILTDTTPLSPTLGSLEGGLYLGWRAETATNLNLMDSESGGQSFHNRVTLSETTSDAPVLATLYDRLFMAWKSEGTNDLVVGRLR